MKTKKGQKGLAGRAAFLTEAELADAEDRNVRADRLMAMVSPEHVGKSELARLVAEIRYWRGRAARSAPKDKSRSRRRLERKEK